MIHPDWTEQAKRKIPHHYRHSPKWLGCREYLHRPYLIVLSRFYIFDLKLKSYASAMISNKNPISQIAAPKISSQVYPGLENKLMYKADELINNEERVCIIKIEKNEQHF